MTVSSSIKSPNRCQECLKLAVSPSSDQKLIIKNSGQAFHERCLTFKLNGYIPGDPKIDFSNPDKYLMEASRPYSKENIPLASQIIKRVALGDTEYLKSELSEDPSLTGSQFKGFVTNRKTTILCIASAYGCLDIVKFLIENIGVDIELPNSAGSTALACAARAGQESIVEYLLSKGANLYSRDKKGFDTLHCAVLSENLTLVETLLKNDLDIDQYTNNGITPLHLAALNDLENMIQLLIENKAGINFGDKYGRSALYFAVEQNHIDAARKLLALGADPQIGESHKLSILNCAVSNGNAEMVKLLIDAKVDVNACMPRGKTALYVAAKKGYLGVVKMLLDHGADPSKAYQSSFFHKISPKEIARRNGHQQIVELIKKGRIIVDRD